MSVRQKLDDNLTGIFVFLLIGVTIIYGSILILGPDNRIEDGAEKYLKDNYDWDVEFSPEELESMFETREAAQE